MTSLNPRLLGFCLALIAGPALGQQSAMKRAYYANPSNLFWRAIHEAGFTPRRYKPEEYTELRTHGIGLTDLCKTAFGNDSELPADAFDRAALERKIRHYRPRILAFTSKTGAANYLGKPTGQLQYGWQPERVGDTRLYVLSSPSGHARRFWRPDIWQALAEEYRRLT